MRILLPSGAARSNNSECATLLTPRRELRATDLSAEAAPAALPEELSPEHEPTLTDRWAALSLALSEKLDRTHRSLVHEAFWKAEKDRVTLLVRADPDATIERTAVEKLIAKANKRMGLGALALRWETIGRA